jgi:hypothetical protein
MTKIIAKTYSLADDNRAMITKTLLAGCLVMAFLYAFNMYSVITKTVAAQVIEKQMVTLASSVQKLDAHYITLSNKITREMASDYGLMQGQVSAYISRTKSVGSVGATVTKL